jgi:Leucine-rich repeat (LRR) protein
MTTMCVVGVGVHCVPIERISSCTYVMGQITKISGLESCFRLKRLQAQNNKVTKLGEGIRALQFLEILALSGNRVRDLKDLLEDLRFLPCLLELGLHAPGCCCCHKSANSWLLGTDLGGNPVIEEDKFRLYVIAVSPKLQVLNCKSTNSPVPNSLSPRLSILPFCLQQSPIWNERRRALSSWTMFCRHVSVRFVLFLACVYVSEF